MHTNGGGSPSKMPSPINFSEALADTCVNKAAAEAESRRRRMPMVKRDEGFPKRKRTSFNRDSGFVPPPLPPNIINQGRLVFLFCKKLQKSDVNNVGRTILPKRSVEAHLPRLLDNESMILPMIDIDGAGGWAFKFRYWPNNLSRMYVFEGTGPFTRKHRLQTGDYMMIYKDMMTWNYIIRAVKASEVEGCATKGTTSTEGNNTDNVVLNDDAAENNDDAEFGTFDLPDRDVSDNFPKMGSLGGTSSMNDDDSYFSDILNSFSSWDEIKDYYYLPTQPNASSDNFSSEDLSQL